MIRQSISAPSRVVRQVIAALAVFNCLCVSVLAAPSDSDRATINRIVAAWHTRADKLGTLHCVAEGTTTVPKGCFNGDEYVPKDVDGDVPSQDHVYPCRFNWLFDFKNARFRIESNREVFSMRNLVFIPEVGVSACDGISKPASLTPREQNTNAAYTPHPNQPDMYINRQVSGLTCFDMIVLLAHGTVPPANRMVSPSDIGGVLAESKDFIIYGHAERDGRECIVLQSNGTRPSVILECWIDEAHQGAIVHCETRQAKGKFYEADVDYQYVSDLWLPKTIHYTQYGAPENPPSFLCQMTITEISPNVPVSDDAFTLKPIEGMVISDEATGLRYRFGADNFPGLVWPVGLLSLLVTVATIVWLRRQKRSAKVRLDSTAITLQ